MLLWRVFKISLKEYEIHLPSNLGNDLIKSTCENYNSAGKLKSEVVNRRENKLNILLYPNRSK